MKKIRWGDDVLELVESPTFEEMSVVERAAGCGWDGLSQIEAAAGSVLIALRRNGVVLSWRDVMGLEPAQIMVVEEEAPDPTPAADGAAPAPAVTPAPKRRRATATTGSQPAARSGSRATAGRSKTS